VPVTMGLSDDKVADISGDIIVWRSYRNNQYDIWMKDVSPSGGAEVPVTNDAFYQNSPRISGDLVVWEDYRNDSNPADDYYNYDIYMKDLTSGIESMLAGGLPIQARPAVDNETVVWEDTTSGNYDIWMATVPDLTAPVINDLTPASGQSAGCAFPAIQASFTDNRVGVDTASVSLIVDGEDVTALSAISDQSILYQPPSMAGGQHSATVTVADLSGNSTSSSWQFDITRPVMGLDALVVYWASYDDYLDHKLSVPYQLFNPSVEITNYSVEILASQTTGGVILSTAGMPIWLGDIAPGNHGDTILKYLVPPNISTFKTTISASSLDACGSSYNFPGPPPEW